ncbi:glycosyltransferase family 4 protein [Celeribacter halophilus]|uniref:glycosyltransferase family 4 protein n=1 Tax=Celeribacter halophilus TaxID=576117 RepID=UPI003A8EC3FF
MLDVDFSLAIHNRTGKYYLGLDIIDTLAPRIETIIYGRRSHIGRTDLERRIWGRLYHWETKARVFHPRVLRLLPKMRSENTVLHLDPLTSLNHHLKSKDIILCHDIGPVTHPQYFDVDTGALYKQAYAEIQQAKCHMIFVSDTSRQEFHKIYGNDFSSSTRIYIPTRVGINKETSVRPDQAPTPYKYFLTVGSIGRRKNQATSIKAFAKSGLVDQGYEYILTGPDEPGADEVKLLAKQTPGVRILGYVSDPELVWLYQNATAFVLMSHLEGFGMPVVEAANMNVPCLVTQKSVLEEVGGSHIFSAPADDVVQIASQMQSLSAMPSDERQAMANKAREFAQSVFERNTILAQWDKVVSDILATVADCSAPNPSP